jgi:hypothetical protein
MIPESMLTVRWLCPVCGCPLSLTKRTQARPEERLSLPDQAHAALGTEQPCLAEVWAILESDEQESRLEGEEPCSPYWLERRVGCSTRSARWAWRRGALL